MRKKWRSFVPMSFLPQFWSFAVLLTGYNAKNGFLKTNTWNLLWICNQKVMEHCAMK
jgi:hypothetical protein